MLHLWDQTRVRMGNAAITYFMTIYGLIESAETEPAQVVALSTPVVSCTVYRAQQS